MKPSHFYSLLAFLLFSSQPAIAREQAPEVKQGVSRQSDKPDIQAALIDWKAAVESASFDDIMKLYDKHAIMISTFAQNPMTKREQIAGYFKKVIVNPDIKIDIEESHPRIFGNFAINSGRYTLSYTQEGEPISIPARFSFAYALEGGKWLIVDQHSSRVPLPEDK